MHIAGQSTKITERDTRPPRLPQYLFDSKQRYFIKNHGLLYAAIVDVTWILGYSLWRIRRLIQGKPDQDPPQLLWDSIRNRVFFKGRLSVN